MGGKKYIEMFSSFSEPFNCDFVQCPWSDSALFTAFYKLTIFTLHYITLHQITWNVKIAEAVASSASYDVCTTTCRLNVTYSTTSARCSSRKWCHSCTTQMHNTQHTHQTYILGMLLCWWWQFDWSFARLIYPVVSTNSIVLSSNKIHNGDILHCVSKKSSPFCFSQ